MARLERTAAADLWKHTLSKIPTVFGRLAYLASLRDPVSGNYRHHGLITSFGREEAVRALKESHAKAFMEWLNLSLAEKNDDLRQYLASLDAEPGGVVAHWSASEAYLGFAPSGAMDVEVQLFQSDMGTLLGFLERDPFTRPQRSGAEPLDRDSWPLA